MKISWMIDRTLTPEERTISECNLYWSDSLPDSEYKINFRNHDGSLSKVHIATKLLE
ncbi:MULTISPECIES: hypothetical protein [Bacillus]|uniref:hypothetical protein n=1 Tax=Bacillus TaxID=1386 RepID=UPI000A93963C|nr:hypothetical protein [Bacillus wiedmannii]